MIFKEPPRSILSTPRDPRSKSWRDFYTLEKMTSFRLNTYPTFWEKKRKFYLKFYQRNYPRLRYKKKCFPRGQTGPGWSPDRLTPNSLHKRIATSDWPIQHMRSKSSQKIYPRENRNHLLLSFRKVLDTYSALENQCNKNFWENVMTLNIIFQK